MAGSSNLKRKAFLIDEAAAKRAKRILGAATEADAVRQSVEQVAGIEACWRSLRCSRGKARSGSFEAP